MVKLSRDQVTYLRANIQHALTAIAKENGLAKLEVGGSQYDPVDGSFSFRLTGVVDGGIAPDARRYDDYRRLAAPQLPKLGERFELDGRAWAVTGMNMSRSKLFVEDLGSRKPYTLRLPAMLARFPAAGANGGGQ